MLKINSSSLPFFCLGVVLSSLFLGANAMAQTQEPLVFIPGLKGSHLESESGEKLWLTPLQAFGLASANISLPLQWNDHKQQSDNVKATGVFSELSLIPGLWAYDLCGPWLKAAQKMTPRFSTFAYDWRRDNNETLEQFIAMLEGVKQRNGGKPVRVVAHSMGGLIAFAALGQRPELFQCLVLAGVPLRGGVGFLEDLHAGKKEGNNAKIASPNVLATFPSVYSFFALQTDRLLENDGKVISADLYKADTWRRLAIGQYAQTYPLPDSEFSPFFQNALNRAREFRQKLTFDSKPAAGIVPAQIRVVASKSHDTLFKVVRGGPHTVLGWDFTSAPKARGDGRVAFEDAFPPSSFSVTTTLSESEHSQLLNDDNVISEVRSFLDSCGTQPQ